MTSIMEINHSSKFMETQTPSMDLELCICEIDLTQANIKPLDEVASNTSEFKEDIGTVCVYCRCGMYKVGKRCRCNSEKYCDDHKQFIQYKKAHCYNCFNEFIIISSYHSCRQINTPNAQFSTILRSTPIFNEIIKPETCCHPTCAFDVDEASFNKNSPVENKDIVYEKQPYDPTILEVWLYAIATCRLCGVKEMNVKSKCTLSISDNGRREKLWSEWIHNRNV